MKTYPEVRIEIKPSNILEGEVGVFSSRSIKKDSVVVDTDELQCKHFPWSIFNKLDNVTQDKIYGYCPGNKKGFCAPPDLNYISIAWHLNHSCSPNVGLDKDYNFVAMRAVSKGEELCWDYAFDESNSKFRMRCHCGSVRCRGMVTGGDWRLLVNDSDCRKYFSAGLRRHVQAVWPPPRKSSTRLPKGPGVLRLEAVSVPGRSLMELHRLHLRRISE